MAVLIVVSDLRDWPLRVPGVQVISARDYLTDPELARGRGHAVFNLCRSYRYQSSGYYVSLLAAARGHRPLPSVATMQDLRLPGVARAAAGDLDEMIQRSFSRLRADRFTLSVYFGRNLARSHDRLARALHALFPVPLLRAQFVREDRWMLQSLSPVAAADVPRSHRKGVAEAAAVYFRRRSAPARRSRVRYELALLVRPDDPEPPSDERALQRFTRAASQLGLRVTRISSQDYGHLAEYDALFIRETTGVLHHTFRFARRAEAEGLVVIDDSASILKCSNKVYLAELLTRHGVQAPRTLIGHSGNLSELGRELGFPCVLKQPDGSFSTGVVKVNDEAELRAAARGMLEKGDLLVAQEFLPTPFDWRVGVLGGEPLYVCRYFMAGGHWQIIDHERRGPRRYGKVEAIALEEAPPAVLRIAVRAAGLIGKGLYGVDVKQVGRRCHVIEVNDNPNIEAGVEDARIGEELYRRVMRHFLERLEARGLAALAS